MKLFMVRFMLTLSPVAGAQSEFDKAHALLDEIAVLQRQERNKNTIERLTALVSSAPGQVREFLNRGIVALLNSPGAHSAEEVQQRIGAALQVVPANEYRPQVFVFASRLERQPALFIAYNFGYCAICSRNWIGVVVPVRGVYQIAASDDDPLPNHYLSMTWLGSTGKQARFLIHGSAWGDAHNRMSAIVYAFDGKELTKTWSLTDLPQGTIRITPTEIIVSFLTALAPPWSERTETYSILTDQIKLRQSLDRPNP